MGLHLKYSYLGPAGSVGHRGGARQEEAVPTVVVAPGRGPVFVGMGSWECLRVAWALVESGLQVEPVPSRSPVVSEPYASLGSL